jgi:glycogen debranching enzyme
MRGIYLQPEEGRTYTVTQERGGYLVSYTDPLLAGTTLYLAIHSPEKLPKPTVTWKQVHYGRDAQRYSEPSNLYVVGLGTATVSSLNLGIGLTADQAHAGAQAASILKPATFAAQPTASPEVVAQHLTEQALQNLHVRSGYYAGFPWFHQHWSRDELITGLGLPLPEQLTLITRYLGTSTDLGELPTFVGSGTYCADGVGWLALLVREVGLNNLPEQTRSELTTFLQGAVSGLNQSRKTPTGLIWSGHNTTWMDTIGRVGCQIEIQAMYGLCLQLLAELTGNTQLEADRQSHLDTIRHTLFQDYLRDGLREDLSLSDELRPNIFLAYLIQPDLLSAEQWDATFKVVLDACWTKWGGVTSLSWKNPLFQAQSTGENNLSYHQGDSWFHVNCLTAIALHRHNHEAYTNVISQLRSSACSELLWQHYLGAPGEIASAESGASWGCGIQGFAGGPLVKLLTEVKN